MCIGLQSGLCAQSSPLPHGHSHNDYTRQRPLFDALELGFTSIEVDVYSFRGEIRVSHLGKRLKRKPRFETLYLDPLAKWIDRHGGQVFPGSDIQLTLMIDLKSDKEKLIPMLSRALDPYAGYIDTDSREDTASAPLRILLSGRPDTGQVSADTTGIFAIDGGFQYLGAPNGGLVKRVSANYRHHFQWKGKGKMPSNEADRLQELVAEAHLAGQKIRFWNSPGKPAVWTVLLNAGVDWINVDDLQSFRDFMDDRNKMR